MQNIKTTTFPADYGDSNGASIEIRAGHGGLDASLFAADLFNMYSNFAQMQGWEVEVVSLTQSDSGASKKLSSG